EVCGVLPCGFEAARYRLVARTGRTKDRTERTEQREPNGENRTGRTEQEEASWRYQRLRTFCSQGQVHLVGPRINKIRCGCQNGSLEESSMGKIMMARTTIFLLLLMAVQPGTSEQRFLSVSPERRMPAHHEPA
ncbi:hypothetical protein LEMLEM_LOCUS1611, partial [Lemmus lemmus]